jgi:hypothetical protein
MRFAERMQLSKDDVVGSVMPHLTGTRSGFNNRAKSYREQVLGSIAKHLPKEDREEVIIPK